MLQTREFMEYSLDACKLINNKNYVHKIECTEMQRETMQNETET